jgi:hypothetical protein
MERLVETAGEVLAVAAEPRWARSLLDLTFGGTPARPVAHPPSVRVLIERSRSPFDVQDARVVTRGAYLLRDGAVVFGDACGSGLDLRLHARAGTLEVSARYRPTAAVRIANRVLGTRFLLLARAVLTQYPVLWWAGVHGRAPLHVSAMSVGRRVVVLAGPSGVGKSTIVRQALAGGGHATSDNLAVSDGVDVFGLVEPLKSDTGRGRRTSHGRREEPLRSAAPRLSPDVVAVVSLGNGRPAVSRVDAPEAVRALVTSTYIAGELRRYWAFAATLAAATGLGPAHPPVAETAARLVERTATVSVALSRRQATEVTDLVRAAEAAAVVG